MKRYSTKTEFFIGLLGVIIHTFVVMFIIAYLSDPSMLTAMIDVSNPSQQELLQQFAADMERLSFMAYVGSAIIIFEWLAIFRILKYADSKTPIWAMFLILGSLYSYFYFGGLTASILLFLSGVMTIFRYKKHQSDN